MRAHLDPGDRHQQQHEGRPHRRGQEGGAGLPRQRPGQREGRRRHASTTPCKTAGRTDARPRRGDAGHRRAAPSPCNTALYDGVLGAIKAAGPGGADAGQRKILVLSDGEDTTATEPHRRRSTRSRSPASASTSSRSQQGDANQPLERDGQRRQGQGASRTADPAALTAAFASEADALARQIVVTAQVPAGFDADQRQRRRHRRRPARQTLTASAYVPVRTRPTSPPRRPPQRHPQPVKAGPLDRLAQRRPRRRRRHRRRPARRRRRRSPSACGKPAQNLTLLRADRGVRRDGGPGPGRPASRRRRPTALAGQARQAAEKALANNKNLEARLAAALEAAGLDLQPAEWLLAPRRHRRRRRPRRAPDRRRQPRPRHPVRRGRAGRPVDLPQGQGRPSGSRPSTPASPTPCS